MSYASRATPVVERRYLDESDTCIRAVELLLKSQSRKEATRPDSPDDAMKGSKDDRARTIIPGK